MILLSSEGGLAADTPPLLAEQQPCELYLLDSGCHSSRLGLDCPSLGPRFGPEADGARQGEEP